jgi:hypothetical protein
MRVSNLVVGLVAGVFLAGTLGLGLRLRAQDEPKAKRGRAPAKADRAVEPAPERSSTLPQQTAKLSVQDALLRPFDMPFGEPTTLAEVAEHLRRALGAPVVLDLGALSRQELTPDDTVELELKGVRLKMGLKLLLDQLELTYRVEPEDNLLIITDAKESDDRYALILEELKSLHHDLHAVQDKLDELLDDADPDNAENAKVLQIKAPERPVRTTPRQAKREAIDGSL